MDLIQSFQLSTFSYVIEISDCLFVFTYFGIFLSEWRLIKIDHMVWARFRTIQKVWFQYYSYSTTFNAWTNLHLLRIQEEPCFKISRKKAAYLFSWTHTSTCVIDTEARLKGIINIQGRDRTRKFTMLKNYSWELHKECSTEPMRVEPTNLLRSQAISGVLPYPLCHGGSKRKLCEEKRKKTNRTL